MTGKTIQEILWAGQQATEDGLPTTLENVVLNDVQKCTERDFQRDQANLDAFERICSDMEAKWGSTSRHP